MARATEWLPATPAKLPRWRGFNLLEKFHLNGGRKPFLESDYRIIAGLGFNFVRLPMDYRFWIREGDWERLDEATLAEIDQAVEWGREYGIHVSINFHRAPGYTVASPPEPTSLWTDPETQRVCALHWAAFARRYRGIPNERLSFNLVNEPANVEAGLYAAAAAKMVEGIRSEDPDRLILSDGLQWGNIPIPELASLGIAQATRGYVPMEVTHYRAIWVGGSDHYPLPEWPRRDAAGEVQDRQWLRRKMIAPWKDLEASGVGVMVGEFGAFSKTPHDVVLRWMEDCLANWQEAGWGWALWNFRGSFGILDSGREDVDYEDFEGHKLDRKMLDLLQRY